MATVSKVFIHVHIDPCAEDQRRSTHEIFADCYMYWPDVFTGGAERSLLAYDLGAQKVVFQKQNAHDHPLTCMEVHGHLVATGDEEGGVKLWDLRQTKQLFSWKENDDYISELAIVPEKNTILAPSGDGTLSVFHMRKAGLESQSDNMEDELLSIVILKHGSKVVCGTQDGILDIWTWGQWGDISDRFPGHPQSIDAIISIDHDTIVTGSSDGLIRVVGIHPNKMLGIVGEHGEYPIENMALSHDNRFLTTSSHDHCIKFWNVAYLFESDEGEEEEVGDGEEETGGEMHTEEVNEDEMETETNQTQQKRKNRKKNSKKSFFAGLK
jgi:WD40 repeat protein